MPIERCGGCGFRISKGSGLFYNGGLWHIKCRRNAEFYFMLGEMKGKASVEGVEVACSSRSPCADYARGFCLHPWDLPAKGGNP